MTTVKEEEDIFEIVDYTTASDWERFIARIEEILSEWKLNGPETSNTEADFADGEWIERNEALEFGDRSYMITHFSLQIPETTSSSLPTENNPQMTTSSTFEKQTFIPPRAMADMMSRRNDFPSHSPYLSHWFGLREFLILSPKRNTDPIIDESRANILLSSTAIAVSNVGCNVPIFIRVQHEWRNTFTGLCEGSGLRTHFNTSYLKSAPHQYRHLAGLLEIFKSKLGSQISNDIVIMVAVRFTYVLREFESTSSRQVLPQDETGMPILTNLPFGSLYDPVSGLHLSCTWPIFSEEVVTENDDCNDFDPILSQQWAIGVTLLEDLPVLLSDAIQKYLNLSTKRETVEQLLGKIQNVDETSNNSMNMADPIKRISDSRTQQYWTSISSSISNTTKRLRVNIFNPPLPPNIVEKTTDYLFNERPTFERRRSIVDELPNDTERIRQLKSVPKDSFVYRLVVCFTAICSLPSINHLRSIAHLWFDIVQELRTHWETGKLIPGLESGSPNLSFSKFYQNLQMLNCCIEHRLRHENDTTNIDNNPMEQDNNDDDDQFYECSSNISPSKSNQTELQPEGRLKPYGDLKLLHTNEILYVPITQECPPATEDMLDEQTTVLTNLGSGEDATLLRAKMQSRSLLSDMESFKAANPLGTIEDFVRWYSPRDWIETEEIDNDGNIQKHYSLSPRMQLPDNLWVEVWQQARPIPVRRQKRLFDDGKEAEKILQKFSSLSPGEVLEQLIPVLLHTVYERIAKEIEDIPDVLGFLENLYAKEVLIIKAKDERKKKLQQDFVECLTSIEQYVCRFQSFKQKLFPLDLNEQEKKEMIQLITELHTRPEIPVKGAANSRLGKRLVWMFTKTKSSTTNQINNGDSIEVKNQFMTPAGKEYILRASIARPSHLRSRPSPQRMYCMLAQDEFRLCGAFSEDTTFF